MTDNPAYTVAAAALLHDIGKLFQRAGVKSDLSDIYRHAHAAVTAEFFTGSFNNFDYGPVFKRFPDLNGETAGTLASMHHSPGTPMQWIIAVADRLAAGFERAESEKYNDYIKSQMDKANFKTVLQRNIFYDVYYDKNRGDSFYPLKPLDPDLLPDENPLLGKSDGEAYRDLADGLLEDINRLSCKAGQYSLPNVFGALCGIMERYCWCVPSATVEKENGRFVPRPCSISLYDHGLSAGALACALYRYHSVNDSLNVESIRSDKEKKFCVIQGDFSGIQDFIFDSGGQSNRFAAKILRAKSFFVSAATQAAAYELCDMLDIPYAAIILNAGGKFTLITGNTGMEQSAVNKLRARINAGFRKLTFGQTKFNIVCRVCGPSDFTGVNFSNLMRRVGNLMEREKLTHDIKEHVFGDYLESAGGKEICAICGQHWSEVEYEEARLCSYCDDFRKIGSELVKSKFLSFGREKGGFKLFDDKYFYFKENPGGLTFDISSDSGFNGYAKKRVSGYIPKKDGLPLTFDKIAEKTEGTNNLAVLKADVDGLGSIFGGGIQNNSISKTATLSRMMDYFFTGWLQKRIEGQNIYTVFSGGDDLFLIGAWNEITGLAGDIAGRLKLYSGGNPEVHISAGVILRKSQVPVREMARAAEEALKYAKDGESDRDNRNRINIFGITVKWEDYFPLMEYADKLLELYAGGEAAVSSGFIYRLLGFAENAELLKKYTAGGAVSADEFMEAAKWQARFRYLVSRNYKDNKEQAERLGELIARYGLAAKIPLSIVIYENRKQGGNNE